jgi:hypothetical protein
MRKKRQREKQQKQEKTKRVEVEQRKKERDQKKKMDHLLETLNETERRPLLQINRILERVGIDIMMEKLEETEKIEAEGGMLLEDNSRQRTKGGVFFYLIKGYLKEQNRFDDIKEIFYKNQNEGLKEWNEAHPDKAEKPYRHHYRKPRQQRERTNERSSERSSPRKPSGKEQSNGEVRPPAKHRG